MNASPELSDPKNGEVPSAGGRTPKKENAFLNLGFNILIPIFHLGVDVSLIGFVSIVNVSISVPAPSRSFCFNAASSFLRRSVYRAKENSMIGHPHYM